MDECDGWINGTLDTWSDPTEPTWRQSLRGGFTSQAGQDKILWQGLFARLGRPGRYIDAAANHYKRISNTFFLDACAHWSGICVACVISGERRA